jgi:host factor-I protein
MDLQKKILDEIKTNKKEIEIVLLKGVRIKGTIEWYDNYSIMINSDGKQQVIYKSAVSTIIT